MNRRGFALAVAAIALSGAALAQTDVRAEFNRRAAARDVELFGQLDRNGDQRLVKEETRGDLNLGPRFDDIDINRDGVVTQEELERYLGQRYGVATSAVTK